MLDKIDRVLVDERSHHRFVIERIADRQRFVVQPKVCFEPLAATDSCMITRRVEVQRWPGRADCAEEDRLRGHIEVGARRDDKRVVAAELHDCSTETAMDGLRNIQTHVAPNRWLRPEESADHPPVFDQRFCDRQ